MIYVNVNWIGLDDSKANKLSFGLGPDLRAAQLDLLPEKQSHPLSCFFSPCLSPAPWSPGSQNIMRLLLSLAPVSEGKLSVFGVYQ